MITGLSSRQYISSGQLHEAGYSNYKIRKLVAEGELSSLNRQWYENLSYTGEKKAFYAVPVYAREGVICLTSAAAWHGLTDTVPDRIDVAIPGTSGGPTSPEHPRMRFYRMSEPRCDLGIEVITEGQNSYRIFDAEKTVCDIVSRRNTLGIDLMVEVLSRYVQRPDRQMDRLAYYARRLRAEKTLRPYLEVLLRER